MVTREHFILFVADQARSTAYYASVLGAAPQLDVPGMTEFELPGGAVLGLMPVDGINRLLDLPHAVQAGGGPRSELYLMVDRPDEWFGRAVRAGAAAIEPPVLRDRGHVAGYALDPDGHLVAFASDAQEL